MQLLVKDNNIIGYASFGGFTDGVEIDIFPEGFEENFKPNKYCFIEGKIIENLNYVPEKSEDTLRLIEELKFQLTSSDYKIIKYQEYILSDLEPPYDIQALNVERQALRDEINKLESCI